MWELKAISGINSTTLVQMAFSQRLLMYSDSEDY